LTYSGFPVGIATPDIRVGADVTGTIAFVARRDEAASVEFSRNFMQDNPDATWALGPVSELPERQFGPSY
jgi:hypothetical protein